MYKITVNKYSKEVKATIEGVFEITSYYEDESEIKEKIEHLHQTMKDMDYEECKD